MAASLVDRLLLVTAVLVPLAIAGVFPHLLITFAILDLKLGIGAWLLLYAKPSFRKLFNHAPAGVANQLRRAGRFYFLQHGQAGPSSADRAGAPNDSSQGQLLSTHNHFIQGNPPASFGIP